MTVRPDWGDRPEAGSSQAVELNLTPLVDVVFALLIIFMVSSAAMIEDGRMDVAAGQVDLALPSGETKPSPQDTTELIVQVDADGNLFEAGDAMDRTTLARTIVERIANEPSLHVRIEADRALPYQQVMELITHLQSIGVRNVGLATREAGP